MNVNQFEYIDQRIDAAIAEGKKDIDKAYALGTRAGKARGFANGFFAGILTVVAFGLAGLAVLSATGAL